MSKKVIDTILSNPKNLDFVIQCSDGEVKTSNFLLRSAIDWFENYFSRWTENVSSIRVDFTAHQVRFLLSVAYYENYLLPDPDPYSEDRRPCGYYRDEHYDPDITWESITLEDLFSRHQILDFYGMTEEAKDLEAPIQRYFWKDQSLEENLKYIQGEKEFPSHLDWDNIFNKNVQEMICLYAGNFIVNVANGKKNNTISILEMVESLEGFEGFDRLIEKTCEVPSVFWKIYPQHLPFSLFNKYLPKMNDIAISKAMLKHIDPDVYMENQDQIEKAMEMYRSSRGGCW